MSDLLSRIRVVDFETTGFPPEAAACEIGWTDLTRFPEGWRADVQPGSSFLDPGHPIPPGASAVHGITDEMVAGAPRTEDVFPSVFRDGYIYAAHNATFDRKFAPLRADKWICTLRCARKIWPDAENHKNEFLRYWLKLNVDTGDMPPHRAGADSLVTAALLMRILEHMTAEECLAASQGPDLLTRMPMGKHRGKLIREVPADYLRWITGSDLSKNIKDTAVAELARRSGQ